MTIAHFLRRDLIILTPELLFVLLEVIYVDRYTQERELTRLKHIHTRLHAHAHTHIYIYLFTYVYNSYMHNIGENSIFSVMFYSPNIDTEFVASS